MHLYSNSKQIFASNRISLEERKVGVDFFFYQTPKGSLSSLAPGASTKACNQALHNQQAFAGLKI